MLRQRNIFPGRVDHARAHDGVNQNLVGVAHAHARHRAHVAHQAARLPFRRLPRINNANARFVLQTRGDGAPVFVHGVGCAVHVRLWCIGLGPIQHLPDAVHVVLPALHAKVTRTQGRLQVAANIGLEQLLNVDKLGPVVQIAANLRGHAAAPHGKVLAKQQRHERAGQLHAPVHVVVAVIHFLQAIVHAQQFAHAEPKQHEFGVDALRSVPLVWQKLGADQAGHLFLAALLFRFSLGALFAFAAFFRCRRCRCGRRARLAPGLASARTRVHLATIMRQPRVGKLAGHDHRFHVVQQGVHHALFEPFGVARLTYVLVHGLDVGDAEQFKRHG